MSRLLHVADRVLNRPLLLHPDKAAVLMGVLAGRIGIEGPDASRFEGEPQPQRDESGNLKTTMYGGVKRSPYNVSGGVAIISAVGSLVNRGAWVGEPHRVYRRPLVLSYAAMAACSSAA